jgi:RNA polymerase sigma factor (sigma-70 family)
VRRTATPFERQRWRCATDDANDTYRKQHVVMDPDTVATLKGGDQRAVAFVATPRRPETRLQAVMEAPHGHEPAESDEDAAELLTVLQDAIEAMDERDRWIFEAVHYRRMSVRQLGRELSLSKTHVHRLYLDITARLAASLANDPIIKERLK